ncbi:MAG: hypothetical protein AABM32_10140 [Chloroflexota bacterium]
MGHHRFKAVFTVILREPGNPSTADPDPMPAELVADVIKEIKKGKPKKGGQPYDVQIVTEGV